MPDEGDATQSAVGYGRYGSPVNLAPDLDPVNLTPMVVDRRFDDVMKK